MDADDLEDVSTSVNWHKSLAVLVSVTSNLTSALKALM